jgi:hypothetical protein
VPGPEVAQNGQRSARQSNHGRNQRRGCFVAVPHDLIELVGWVCIFRCRMTPLVTANPRSRTVTSEADH